MPSVNTIEKLFEKELKDIYDAEKRLTKALPKMAKAAASEELKSAFEEHLQVTQNQVGRLDQIFDTLGKKAAGKPCAGMKGLIEEGEETIADAGEEPFGDLGLIAAARRVEHYEMAAYMSLRSLAEHMEDPSIVELIDETLREEEESDEQLSAIADELLEGTAEEIDEEDVEEEVPAVAAPRRGR